MGGPDPLVSVPLVSVKWEDLTPLVSVKWEDLTPLVSVLVSVKWEDLTPSGPLWIPYPVFDSVYVRGA